MSEHRAAPEAAGRGLTVAEMVAATGLTAHTLRWYERVGLIRPIARTTGGQRRYDDQDVGWVTFLLRLRETGMPVAQMREYADLRSAGPATTRARLGVLERHQAGLRERIAQLMAHDAALDAKIAAYQALLGATTPADEEREGTR